MDSTNESFRFSGLNVTALVMIFLTVPETKQRTLEELDYIFAVPVRKFIRYQCTQALPWWFKRWVLFQRNAELKPLYQIDLAAKSSKKEEKYKD